MVHFLFDNIIWTSMNEGILKLSTVICFQERYYIFHDEGIPVLFQKIDLHVWILMKQLNNLNNLIYKDLSTPTLSKPTKLSSKVYSLKFTPCIWKNTVYLYDKIVLSIIWIFMLSLVFVCRRNFYIGLCGFGYLKGISPIVKYSFP